MNKFNLEAARNGAAVVTRDGRTATIIDFRPRLPAQHQLLVGIGEMKVPVMLRADGRFHKDAGKESAFDLFMEVPCQRVKVFLYADGTARWVKDGPGVIHFSNRPIISSHTVHVPIPEDELCL